MVQGFGLQVPGFPVIVKKVNYERRAIFQGMKASFVLPRSDRKRADQTGPPGFHKTAQKTADMHLPGSSSQVMAAFGQNAFGQKNEFGQVIFVTAFGQTAFGQN